MEADKARGIHKRQERIQNISARHSEEGRFPRNQETRSEGLKMGYLTIAEQHLMLEMLERGSITYKSQKTFNSRRFFDAIRNLKKRKLVNPICAVCRKEIPDNHHNICDSKKCRRESRNSIKYFELTLKGELFGEELKDFDNHTVGMGRPTIKLKTKKSLKKACERCGIENKKLLIIHHIDHDPENNSIENLKTVCWNCHFIEHDYNWKKVKEMK